MLLVMFSSSSEQYQEPRNVYCFLQILMSVPRILVLVMKMQTVAIVTVLIAVLVSKDSLAMARFVTV